MRTSVPVVLLVAAGCVAGCTTSATPATAPDTTATTTTSAPATTTSRPLTTTTTLDRTAEIQAIFDELEYRRLEAIKRNDEVAFRELYANDRYLGESLSLLQLVEVADPRGFATLDFVVLAETDDCIAALITRDLSSAISGGETTQRRHVIEASTTSPVEWGYSWIGEGWTCDGPHPLSSSP